MTREFFGRLVKIFDGWRREIETLDRAAGWNLPHQEKRSRLQEKFDLIMQLLDVQHTDSPLWVNMILAEKIERMYMLCKSEYDSTQPVEAAIYYTRSIDLGDLHAK